MSERQYDDIYEDGDYRKGVLDNNKTNVLLVRTQLGKVKQSTYELPHDGFVYGKRDPPDEEGAREVVGSWKVHRSRKTQHMGRDFIGLNRAAAATGCITSKDVSHFRRANDLRVANTATLSRSTRLPSSSYPDVQRTFGRPSKPSDPIGTLISNVHQREFIKDQRKKRTGKSNQEKKRSWKPSVHTRASLGHVKVKAPEPKPLYKLARYQNVPSRVGEPRGFRGTQSALGFVGGQVAGGFNSSGKGPSGSPKRQQRVQSAGSRRKASSPGPSTQKYADASADPQAYAQYQGSANF